MISAAGLGCAAASELPEKAALSRYTGLWSNSPFTSRPPPAAAEELVNPLSDFTLLGVSPINGGYRVTLFDKKKPTERIMVESDNPRSPYKVLEVLRKPGDPLGTTVRLSSGTTMGTVAYDEKSLNIAPRGAAPPPPMQPPPNPGIPPAQPVQIDPGGVQSRQPRPRVVPPPMPGNGGVPPIQNPNPTPPQFLPDGTPMREPNPPPGGPFPRRQGAANNAPAQGQPVQPTTPRSERRRN
jgi:hypothetical protein